MKYRKKPIVIDAVQWNGRNLKEVQTFIGSETLRPDLMNSLPIVTLEGAAWASVGDWIIKGIAGEFYPCKPGVFEDTYEAVDEAKQ